MAEKSATEKDLDRILSELQDLLNGMADGVQESEALPAAMSGFTSLATAAYRVSSIANKSRIAMQQQQRDLGARFGAEFAQAMRQHGAAQSATAGMLVHDSMGGWRGNLLAMLPPIPTFPAGRCAVCLTNGQYAEVDARHVIGPNGKALG